MRPRSSFSSVPPRENREELRKEGSKEGLLAGIAIISCLFVYCGCFYLFFVCQFQNLCEVVCIFLFFFFFAVADCEGFWSKEDGGLRDFLVFFVCCGIGDRTGEATLSSSCSPGCRSYGYGCGEDA